jgi:hypothetical protein
MRTLPSALRRNVDLIKFPGRPMPYGPCCPMQFPAVREQPVEARADQHHHVGPGQHVAVRRRGLRVSGSRPFAMDIARYDARFDQSPMSSVWAYAPCPVND